MFENRSSATVSNVGGNTDLFEPVETTRLWLRCIRANDAERISEMMTPSVSRWVASWPVPFTTDMAAERIASMRQSLTSRRALPCAIERRSDGALIGWVSVARSKAEDRRIMLGYWMGGAYQGYGYMREAASAAVRLAFQKFDLDVIEAAVQPENTASFAVLRSCGMTPVGQRTIFAPARARDEFCIVYETIRANV